MTSIIKQIQTPTFIGQHIPHVEGEPILETENLTIYFGEKPAIENVSFTANVGDKTAIVGPNGAGKSTLIKAITGLITPSSGAVRIFGHDPKHHVCIAYVPQRSQVDWTFPASVADVVMMGRVGKLGLFHTPKKADWEYVNHCLEMVELGGFESRQIEALSGGEQQRMFLARALAQESELMLLDEPITGLDLPSQQDVFDIIDKITAAGVTALVSLHDLQIASQRFDKVMLLNKTIVGYGPAADVFSKDNLVLAYGAHLHMIESDEENILLSDTCCEGDEEHAHD